MSAEVCLQANLCSRSLRVRSKKVVILSGSPYFESSLLDLWIRALPANSQKKLLNSLKLP